MVRVRFSTAGRSKDGARFTCIMLCISPLLVVTAYSMSDFMHGRSHIYTLYQLAQTATCGLTVGVLIGHVFLRSSRPARSRYARVSRDTLQSTCRRMLRKIQ